uniref:ABC transporter domain-containing protein n=1 Tax=Panagrolaimus sp. ES5 TaxID=591445 RepID=A0AC34GTN1_9BILA
MQANVSGQYSTEKLLASKENTSKDQTSKEKEQSSQAVFCPPAPGALHDVFPLTLAWHNIHVAREKPSGVVILDNINGQALPNEVVALMGASGAGKTTLLNSLMGRNLKGLDVTGDIYVGGSKHVKIVDVSGYVQQEEMFMSTLTVYEHLSIQAGIRLAGLSKASINERLTEIMDELGLTKCKDSIIGLSGVKKGISGGEAKRLMVASVLLDNPSIIFLDEPTTGLDAHMAQSLMNSLQKLAKDGRTIVCTIHQPSTSIFNALDKVIFLADGQLAYLGPPKTILPFFDSLGLVCPDDFNPADYIIDMLAIDRTNGKEEIALERIHKVCRGYTESPLTKHIYEEIKIFEGCGAENGIPDNRRRASFLSQVLLIFKRSLIDNRRNPALARAKIFQKIIQGLFVGAVYWQIEYLTYSALFGVLTFMPNDFPLVVREHFDGLYYVPAYYIARILSYMPIFILDGTLMMGISYYMVNFAPGAENFFTSIGIGILIEQSATAFGVMLSTICPSYAIALSITGPLLTILTLTGGLYANVAKIEPYIRWVQYCSWFKYGFEALTINHWYGMPITEKNGTYGIGNITKTAKQILDDYSFDENNFWIDIGAMIAFILLFYFIGYIGLHIRVRLSR